MPRALKFPTFRFHDSGFFKPTFKSSGASALFQQTHRISELFLKGHRITIFGEKKHSDPVTRATTDLLANQAIQGKSALFMEGVERSDAGEALIVKKSYGSDVKGLFLGIEDPFANFFSGMIMSYMILVKYPEQKNKCEDFAWGLITRGISKAQWQKLKQSGYDSPLFTELDAYVAKNSEKDSTNFIKGCYNLSNFQDIAQWLDLYRHLIIQMKWDAAARGADITTIQRVLENPHDYYVWREFLDSICGAWRDRFMADNVYAALDALPAGIDVNIAVGEAHREGLVSLLKNKEKQSKNNAVNINIGEVPGIKVAIDKVHQREFISSAGNQKTTEQSSAVTVIVGETHQGSFFSHLDENYPV